MKIVLCFTRSEYDALMSNRKHFAKRWEMLREAEAALILEPDGSFEVVKDRLGRQRTVSLKGAQALIQVNS